MLLPHLTTVYIMHDKQYPILSFNWLRTSLLIFSSTYFPSVQTNTSTQPICASQECMSSHLAESFLNWRYKKSADKKHGALSPQNCKLTQNIVLSSLLLLT